MRRDETGLFAGYEFIKVCNFLGVPPIADEVDYSLYVLGRAALHAENQAKALIAPGQ